MQWLALVQFALLIVTRDGVIDYGYKHVKLLIVIDLSITITHGCIFSSHSQALYVCILENICLAVNAWIWSKISPDSKVHGAYPGGPHVGPMIPAI